MASCKVSGDTQGRGAPHRREIAFFIDLPHEEGAGTSALEKAGRTIIPWVFYRDGRRIKSYDELGGRHDMPPGCQMQSSRTSAAQPSGT